MEVNLGALQEETRALWQEFREHFGDGPEFVASAPGRVNLIGEHTDYNLLPVLPMSLARRIRLYGRETARPVVRIRNRTSEFSADEIRLDEPISPTPGRWTNYMRAALAHLQNEIGGNERPSLRGMDILVDSDLPPAAGLSSSSALVIATCLAALRVNGVAWSPRELAEHMAYAEKFVGTAGGGMDQTAIAMGEEQGALRIEFDPLRVQPVNVPDSLRIFVINSGQRAEKSGAAKFHYNRRSLECSVAARMLANRGTREGHSTAPAALRDVFDACARDDIAVSALVLQRLPVDPPSVAEIRRCLGDTTFEELCRERHLDPDHTAEWLPEGRLQVFSRASHVLAEAGRVYAMESALAQGDLSQVGHLARASHASCRDLYHISTPRLEELVNLGQRSGALAVRITGAGFGGSLVAFVEAPAAAEFATSMMDGGVDSADLIETSPGGRAGIVDLAEGGA